MVPEIGKGQADADIFSDQTSENQPAGRGCGVRINELRQTQIRIDKFVNMTFRNRERSVNRNGTPLSYGITVHQNKVNTNIFFVKIVRKNTMIMS